MTALCIWKLSTVNTCDMYIAHLVVHLDLLQRSIADKHSQNSSRSKLGVDTQQESLDTSFLNAVPQQCNHALKLPRQVLGSMVSLLLQGSQESLVWE